MKSKKPHMKLIEDYLLVNGNTLTGLQAIALFGCYRLSSVINRIRAKYHYDCIKCEIQEPEKYGKYTWNHIEFIK